MIPPDLTRYGRFICCPNDQDLHRTFPEHSAFQANSAEGEENISKLRRILNAYSAFDPAVGYCQGMNFIAGTLLVFLEEEAAFYTFLMLMQRASEPLRSIFLPNMKEALLTFGVLHELTRTHLPKLARHFRRLDVTCDMFCTEWYMTLFSRSFPVSLCARILDILLAEGDGKIIHRIALTLLKSDQKTLLAIDDMGELVMRLKQLPEDAKNWPSDGAGDFVVAAYRMKLSRAEIVKIRKALSSSSSSSVEEPRRGNF